MDRRTFLATAGTGLTGALAGCSSVFGETTYGREPPLIEDRPDAVYVPTHTEEMRRAGAAAADGVRVSLAWTYPHRFWRLERGDDGYEARKFEVGPDHAVHLMVDVWTEEGEVPVPAAGVSVEVTRGEFYAEEVVYPMLSQRMGFHYGDNYPLGDDGEYVAAVTVGGGLSAERFGAFEADGLLDEPAVVEIPFEFDAAARDDLESTRLEDRQGDRGAVEPMSAGADRGGHGGGAHGGDGGHGAVPVGRARDLPGEPLGEGTADDVTYRASIVEADRFGGEPYLAVTASTPYNEFVVPNLGLAATVDRGGETVFDGRLSPGIDPEIGYHYGARGAFDGDAAVELSVETPAQVARHEGYETAFLDAPTLALE